MTRIFVGCAGWSLRKELADRFPPAGTHLQRYAARFGAVEINSSFYRFHRHTTYVRWADSTPEHFRFAVKVPKLVTHQKRLAGADEPLERFLSEISGLGSKLGAVLVQLPPSLVYQPAVAESFISQLRSKLDAPVVCEPRHPTWFGGEPDALLKTLGVSRVAADPAVVPVAGGPGGHRRVVYFRWHGSPKMYYSSYDESQLQGLAGRLLDARAQSQHVWCIFDNTAEGEAVRNALRLQELLRNPQPAA